MNAKAFVTMRILLFSTIPQKVVDHPSIDSNQPNNTGTFHQTQETIGKHAMHN
jgi:hypothetical protein